MKVKYFLKKKSKFHHHNHGERDKEMMFHQIYLSIIVYKLFIYFFDSLIFVHLIILKLFIDEVIIISLQSDNVILFS